MAKTHPPTEPAVSVDDGSVIIPPPVRPGPTGPTHYERQQLRSYLVELAQRQAEALRLYESLPVANRFHECRRQVRVLRGSNRAGKTLAAAVECARIVTGRDPFAKLPAEGGIAFLVGRDERHLGDVMWQKLSRAGAFKIIRDPATKQWRAFRPHEPADVARLAEARPAPPLIPRRLIADIAWLDKKRGIPALVTLRNGWKLHFFSSKAEPPQGSAVDFVWFDEEIEGLRWLGEMLARLLDRQGMLVWSATPQAGTDELYGLHERYQAGDEDVGEFLTLLADNPHIPQTEKDKLEKGLNEDERRVRILGEFALTGFLVYPEFAKSVHLVKHFPIPADWARYLSVDPGRQRCAITFLAVPPPGGKDHVYAYDELYLKNCDAEVFATSVAERSKGVMYEAFLVDHRASGVHEMGSGLTVEYQYSRALERKNIYSARTGSGFVWGSDDVKGGILAVRDWLRIRQDGTPRLVILEGTCPNLIWEFERYRYKRDPKTRLPTEDVEKRNDHLMDTLRYLALFNPRWRKPPAPKRQASPAVKAMRRKAAKRRDRSQGHDAGIITLGPAAAGGHP